MIFCSAVRQPARPTRPSLPPPLKPSAADDSPPNDCLLESDAKPTNTQHCFQSPLTPDSTAPPQVRQERPRPRPRSRRSAPAACSEVKVQTLVKLREDGSATLAARAKASQGEHQGKYLQELLEAFSADHWGFPERRSDASDSESEKEDDDEQDDGQDMAALKARIQVFEQQPVSDGSSGSEEVDPTKRPEPRPRPRLQPPTIAPKPKNFSHAPKPSTKLFWEAANSTAAASDSCSFDGLEPASTLQVSGEKSRTHSTVQSCRETERPTAEALLSDNSVPVPAPRPPQPRLPPRPAAAPRVIGGPAMPGTRELPPRSERTQDAMNTAGKCLLPLTTGSSLFRGI